MGLEDAVARTAAVEHERPAPGHRRDKSDLALGGARDDLGHGADCVVGTRVADGRWEQANVEAARAGRCDVHCELVTLAERHSPVVGSAASARDVTRAERKFRRACDRIAA